MPRINAYTCDKLHSIVTIDRNKGVTPMFLSCEICGGRSVSRMYQVDESLEPTHEWYKPTEQDIVNEAKDFCKQHPEISYETLLSAMKEHASKGGLSIRKIQTIKP